jgi:two-component system, OmpR family, phosphate regulon sensor histidine kinase PhoR
MAQTPRDLSPIAVAALLLIEDGTARTELGRRFDAVGASVEPVVVERALEDLVALGLARMGRGTADDPRFVLTSLGRQAAGRARAGDAAVELEELERLRTHLLSTIAHELRTPLTAVRTSVGLLLDPSSHPSDAQRQSMLATIDRNAERMQRVVGDILDLARFRSGAIRLQLRRFDARDVIEAGVSVVTPLAEAAGQRIEVEAASNARIRVYGDRPRLDQAFLNLLSNAQRFSPAGGTIHISLGEERNVVRWSVRDEGPGIPAEDQPRLFERFFVGPADRHARGEGIGLGLPTALAIAQAHGGAVEVDSVPGTGSTFHLAVPLDGPPEEG